MSLAYISMPRKQTLSERYTLPGFNRNDVTTYGKEVKKGRYCTPDAIYVMVELWRSNHDGKVSLWGSFCHVLNATNPCKYNVASKKDYRSKNKYHICNLLYGSLV